MLERLRKAGVPGLVAASVLAGLPASAQTVARDRSFDLAGGWRFALVNDTGIDDPTGAYARAASPDFDASGWRTVRIPHDWSIGLDPRTGDGTSAGSGFLPGGLAWYRKRFVLPKDLDAGSRVFVEFDGIYMDSYVYVNGELVGNHPYGYTGFAFDITDDVVADGTTRNLIAVRVRNRLPSSRWYSGSGIYRNARIVITDAAHVARHGVYLATPDLEQSLGRGRAGVHIETSVVNDGGRRRRLRIVSRVLDPAGTEVAAGRSSIAVNPRAGGTAATDLDLVDPALWSPADPALYTLVTEVYAGHRLVDKLKNRFGLRYVDIDPDTGFSLNGRPMKIRGVNLHHDSGALGAAVNRDALIRQMRILKRMGVNAVRTAHNPPAPELVEVCEDLGIMLMIEAFDMWQEPKTRFDYAQFFDEWSAADIEEMVLAARNSPAVILWSIGNEIRGMSEATAGRLAAAVRAVDPSRPVVMGSDAYRALPAPGSATDSIVAILDGLGVNYNTAMSIDELHDAYPDTFIFESESSSSTSTRGVYQDPDQLNTGENYTPGRRAVSSYDNNMAPWTMPAEYGLKKDRDRPFFAGQFLWSGFDYIGEPTPYFRQFPVKSSFFGAVDTAGFPKDVYWLFRSQWTSDPMVHLLPMNWTDYCPGEPVEVWAYANVDTVELFLNGQSLGIRRFDHKRTASGVAYLETTEPSGDDKSFASGSYSSPNGSSGKLHLGWTVPFAPGTLVAVARDKGVVVARDTLRTAGPAYALRTIPDRHVMRADQRSLAFVTVEVVDAAGVVVPNASNAIDFSVDGGEIAGLDNGRPESAENYQGSRRSAFNGKALAILRSDGTAGALRLTAASPGLVPATVILYELTDANLGSSAIAGAGPVLTRAMTGAEPSLPGAIDVVFADGHVESRPVHWANGGGQAAAATRIRGSVTALDLPVEAIVTRYAIDEVETPRATVPVGIAPLLPATLRVSYTDGESQALRVVWDRIPAARLATAGTFEWPGRLQELALNVAAFVTVTDRFETDRPLTGPASPVRATADASFSGSPMRLPAQLVDGIIAEDDGWSNFYRKPATPVLEAVSRAHASDWVSVRWEEPVVIDRVVVHFTTTDGTRPPAGIRLRYWNGNELAATADADMRPAADGEPALIEFGPVATNALRLEMRSASPGSDDGFIGITELEVYGDAIE